MKSWDDWVHPDYPYPRHRLIWTLNWINFKACARVMGWGLVLLAVLVVIVRGMK